MKITVKNFGEQNRGYEVVVELDNGQSTMWPFAATSTEERMLVPEARRFAKELKDAIAQAEKMNKQLLPKKSLGEY